MKCDMSTSLSHVQMSAILSHIHDVLWRRSNSDNIKRIEMLAAKPVAGKVLPMDLTRTDAVL